MDWQGQACLTSLHQSGWPLCGRAGEAYYASLSYGCWHQPTLQMSSFKALSLPQLNVGLACRRFGPFRVGSPTAADLPATRGFRAQQTAPARRSVCIPALQSVSSRPPGHRPHLSSPWPGPDMQASPSMPCPQPGLHLQAWLFLLPTSLCSLQGLWSRPEDLSRPEAPMAGYRTERLGSFDLFTLKRNENVLEKF